MSNVMQGGRFIAVLALFAIAIAAWCWHHGRGRRPSDKDIVAAQDEVYSAVVRDMITPKDGRVRVTQLVFGETVLIPMGYVGEGEPCETRARKQMWLENSQLPYDTLADKAYRFFSRDSYDDTLRPDTVRNFIEKFCTPGQLSQTFHTDLPRTFIGDERIDFGGDGLILVQRGRPAAKKFPGAHGIISFSRVGFNSQLDEAIVATSFVCGGLCGAGSRYVLRKKQGHWQVVNKWMVWVS